MSLIQSLLTSWVGLMNQTPIRTTVFQQTNSRKHNVEQLSVVHCILTLNVQLVLLVKLTMSAIFMYWVNASITAKEKNPFYTASLFNEPG